MAQQAMVGQAMTRITHYAHYALSNGVHCARARESPSKVRNVRNVRNGQATRRWVAKARITDDPAGDLIADMRRDPALPGLFPNIQAMRDHLRRRGACREALAAVPVVWRRYRNWMDRHPDLNAMGAAVDI